MTCDCCPDTAMTCEKPPPAVTHGHVLFNNKKKFFYCGDQVEILCELGFVIDDGKSSNNHSMQITCSSDQIWDAIFLNCTGMITFNYIIMSLHTCMQAHTCIHAHRHVYMCAHTRRHTMLYICVIFWGFYMGPFFPS